MLYFLRQDLMQPRLGSNSIGSQPTTTLTRWSSCLPLPMCWMRAYSISEISSLFLENQKEDALLLVLVCLCTEVWGQLCGVVLSSTVMLCHVMCCVGSVSRFESTFTFSTILLPRQSISYHYKYLENWRYSNHPFIYGHISHILYLSVQLQLENIKWEVTQISNSHILNCMLIGILWLNLKLYFSIWPALWIIPFPIHYLFIIS